MRSMFIALGEFGEASGTLPATSYESFSGPLDQRAAGGSRQTRTARGLTIRESTISGRVTSSRSIAGPARAAPVSRVRAEGSGGGFGEEAGAERLTLWRWPTSGGSG